MIGLILMLALVGLLTWAMVTYVPMPAGIRTAIIAIVIVLMILYVINVIGIDIPIPHLKR